MLYIHVYYICIYYYIDRMSLYIHRNRFLYIPLILWVRHRLCRLSSLSFISKLWPCSIAFFLSFFFFGFCLICIFFFIYFFLFFWRVTDPILLLFSVVVLVISFWFVIYDWLNLQLCKFAAVIWAFEYPVPFRKCLEKGWVKNRYNEDIYIKLSF